MSVNEITAKIESLKEWEALAAEATAQVESLKDELKQFMNEQGVEEYEAGTHIIRWTKVLGHASPNTTGKFYAHMIEDAKAAATDTIADVLIRRKA